MRSCFVLAGIVALATLAWAQEAATPPKSTDSQQFGSVTTDPTLKNMFEGKVRAEWEALKNKDKKAYAELLADDYQGVEIDGRGERNKIQSVNDLTDTSGFNYTLERLKLIPLGANAAFVIYEVTMQFPPKAQLRFSRVYISELWVKRADQWKELHYQETHVK
jgi:Domain of unknown function (DUF4440)